jgi:hypothetical protein
VSGDEYRPREHDYFVEPMFGGLGVEGGPRTSQPLWVPSAFRRLWARLWRALVALVRPARGG